MKPVAERPALCPQCRMDTAVQSHETDLSVAHCLMCGWNWLYVHYSPA